jgi:hypothetical protein
MDGLGRVFNIVPTADNVEVDMTEASAVTFVCVGADTYTVQDASDAAGTGAANLAVIDHYYTNTSAAGANAWARVPQAVAASFVLAAAVAVFTVDATQLRDGFKYLRCASTAAGLVYAILHDLEVQRAPQNLKAAAT